MFHINTRLQAPDSALQAPDSRLRAPGSRFQAPAVAADQRCFPGTEAAPDPRAPALCDRGGDAMLGVEIALLRGFLTRTEEEEWRRSAFCLPDVGRLLEQFFVGDFRGVVMSPVVKEILCGDGGHVGEGGASEKCGHVGEDLDLEAHLEKRFKTYLNTGPEEEQKHRELLLLLVSVSSLQMFAQCNWTGPPLDLPESDLLPPDLIHKQVCSSVLAALLLDGEEVYPLVSHPLLLLFSRIILTQVLTPGTLKLVSWWTLRYVSLHQQILEACSPQLLSLSQSCITSVSSSLSLLEDSVSLQVQFHIECVYVNLTYFQFPEAKSHMTRAQSLSGLSVNLTGALGKRTRFQQKSLAQLVLEVKRSDTCDWSNSETSPAPTPVHLLPKDCALNDDTRLENISLEDPDQFQLPDLSPEEQAVVLGLCTDFQKNNPLYKLTEEELLTFTSALLSQPKIFSLEVSALSLRTKLERGQRRCVERAMMQTQTLVDYLEETSCPVSERLKMFYVCRPPTRWNVQKTLASLLMDLGCTSSALLTFEKLQMWEDVVICHERLGHHGKAEEIVRRELQKQQTVTLWCLLGDILRQHEFYDQAWELSKHRSSRAMRSKGLLHLQHRETEEGVKCFEESLRINRMQLGLWFSLGCGYLTLENYEGAARAFQSCVCIEPDNAEAWNNLSTAYIRLKKEFKAFLTLQEALKCNFESWQIWENFLLVSTNIGGFSEAIRAYHRLMDLRDGFKDLEVLQYLVRAVVQDLPDRQGAPSSLLKPKLKELLGRVSARHSGERDVWLQYALLYGGGASESAEDNDKALHFLSKAHRCEVQTSDWHQDPALFKGVLQRALCLGRVSVSVARSRSSPAEALQVLSSSRLSLNSLLSKAKQNHTDVATGEIHPEMKDEAQTLEKLIKEIQEVSADLRSQSQ